MKRLAILVCLLLALVSSAPSGTQGEEIVVATRNVYFGANLDAVLAAQSPQEFVVAVLNALATIDDSEFSERADALAQEIAERRPHLIALQEVFDFTLGGEHPGGPYRDYLADLLNALAVRGLEYDVVGVVRNWDIPLPLPIGFVRVVDRDVVLARRDVDAASVPVPGCRVSLDGCDFETIVSIQTPVGAVPLERGFLVVDALIGTQPVRFVNTHLEILELSPTAQAAQAAEMIARLATLANPLNAPVVIAGDINSPPTDLPTFVNGQIVVPPYRQFAQAGYVDTWLLRPGRAPGFTCCQSPSLRNEESELSSRIDVIFVDRGVVESHANVFGNEPDDRTPSGLWPSDHAGVVTRLRFGGAP